jgi:chorismate mutase
VRCARQQEEAIGMDISDWRKKIDELDEQIVALISKRAEAAQAIGELKRTRELPVYEPGREQTVFDHVRAVNPGPLADTEMLHVYERIIDVMRTLQRRDA